MRARARYLSFLSRPVGSWLPVQLRPQPFGAFDVPETIDPIIATFPTQRLTVIFPEDLELQETQPLGAAAPEEKL